MFRYAYDCEDVLGLVRDDNYITVRWLEARIFFSFAQRGNAISAHFSADRQAICQLRKAIDEFCEWAFNALPWCTMVLACIKRASVARLVERCGFEYVTNRGDVLVYARCK